MSGWKIEATKRVNLPDDIADGLWISIHHPKLMPFEPMKQLLAMGKTSTGDKTGDKTASNFDLEQGRDLVTSMIVDWNIPGEDGQILPVPSKDPSVWNRVPPMPIIMAVFQEMGQHVKATQPDPNSFSGSANS